MFDRVKLLDFLKKVTSKIYSLVAAVVVLAPYVMLFFYYHEIKLQENNLAALRDYNKIVLFEYIDSLKLNSPQYQIEKLESLKDHLVENEDILKLEIAKNEEEIKHSKTIQKNLEKEIKKKEEKIYTMNKRLERITKEQEQMVREKSNHQD